MLCDYCNARRERAERGLIARRERAERGLIVRRERAERGVIVLRERANYKSFQADWSDD